MCVRSLFRYAAREEDELSFPAGVIIKNVDKFDPAWWRGDYEGQLQALFPANYVQEIEPPPILTFISCTNSQLSVSFKLSHHALSYTPSVPE